MEFLPFQKNIKLRDWGAFLCSAKGRCLILLIVLMSSIRAFSQKDVLTEQKLTDLTLQTKRDVSYKVRYRYKREHFVPKQYNEYDDALECYVLYDDKKRRAIRYLTGRPLRTFLSLFFLRIIYSFAQEEKVGREVISFYGLKSSTDGRQLVPSEYNEVYYPGKELYVFRNREKAALYFRIKEFMTPFCWDTISSNPYVDMNCLRKGDSSCIVDNEGNVVVKMLRGWANADLYGAIIRTDTGLSYLDSSHHHYVLKGIKNAWHFVNGIGVSRSDKYEFGGRLVNLKGELISDEYKEVIPYYLGITAAMDTLEKWALLGPDGKPVSNFMFRSINYFEENHGYSREMKANDFFRHKPGMPLLATTDDAFYLFDLKGTLLTPVPLNYFEGFTLLNMAVAGRKNKLGTMMYTLIDTQGRELVPYTESKIRIASSGDSAFIENIEVIFTDPRTPSKITIRKLKDLMADTNNSK